MHPIIQLMKTFKAIMVSVLYHTSCLNIYPIKNLQGPATLQVFENRFILTYFFSTINETSLSLLSTLMVETA